MNWKVTIIYLFISISAIAQNGIRKTYYSKTRIESKVSFVNGVKDGNAKWFYENGNLRVEKNYSNGKLNGWLKEFYKNGLLKKEQYVRNGILDGISNEYYDNGELKKVAIYTNGILEKITEFTYDSNYVASLDEYKGRAVKKNKNVEYFFCDLDVCPEPVNGLEEIKKEIINSIDTNLNNIKASVLITAKVNKYGKVTDVKTDKQNEKLNAVITQVMEKTKFIPGREKGKNVDSSVSFRINLNKVKN